MRSTPVEVPATGQSEVVIERLAQDRWRGSFPADDLAARRARAFVSSVFDAWAVPEVDDVTLLTSEAVANAYAHTDTRLVTVDIARSAGCARVSVHDEDPRRPAMRPQQPGSTEGFGLRLIRGLADRWGVEDVQDDGKAVWFEVELPGATPTRRP
jgi:anti-sigma regulatory factor (Ser/Thr protein kinase)